MRPYKLLFSAYRLLAVTDRSWHLQGAQSVSASRRRDCKFFVFVLTLSCYYTFYPKSRLLHCVLYIITALNNLITTQIYLHFILNNNVHLPNKVKFSQFISIIFTCLITPNHLPIRLLCSPCQESVKAGQLLLFSNSLTHKLFNVRFPVLGTIPGVNRMPDFGYIHDSVLLHMFLCIINFHSRQFLVLLSSL